MKIYKSLFPLFVVAFVLIATLAFPNTASAVDPVTTSEQFPVDFRVVNVCSGNFDEVIQLDGTLHVNSTTVSDGKGGFHATSHANWQGVEGTNLTTGEKYRFITRGMVSFNAQGSFPFESTRTTHNNLVGQGTGLILITQIVFKTTVNANGEVTTQFAHQSAECKE
jgi:hypothetical protein